MIGQFNAAFFTGEILTMYAILGIILPIFCRMSDRTVVIFATLLILQPIDWVKLIYALYNPDYVAGKVWQVIISALLSTYKRTELSSKQSA